MHRVVLIASGTGGATIAEEEFQSENEIDDSDLVAYMQAAGGSITLNVNKLNRALFLTYD